MLELKSPQERIAFLKATVLDNVYIPHKPSLKQSEFLVRIQRELFFGGAAGGGKSDAVLMGALQFVNYPNYAATIFRRSFADLNQPDALIPRSKEWLTNKDCHWNEKEHQWSFPSGSTLTFNYLESENDIYKYQSAAYQYIAFDELTQFTEKQYTYLFSRLRRLAVSDIPLRMRSSSNPGNIGHKWVKERFVDKGIKYFIPSRLEDNPYLDKTEYLSSLSQLDIVNRQRLREGNWEIEERGNKFNPAWFTVIDTYPKLRKIVRWWDLAGGKQAKDKAKSQEPDWTIGLKMGIDDKKMIYILNVKRFQRSPHETEKILRQTAIDDGIECRVRMELEPGSEGIHLIDHYKREVFRGFAFKEVRSTGDKVLRADPFSSYSESGYVYLIRSAWNKAYLDELTVFPNKGFKDDQVDASSGAFQELSQGSRLTELMVENRQRLLNAVTLAS